MDIQDKVNAMSKNLRLAVIRFLIVTDLAKFKALAKTEEKEIEWMTHQIDGMKQITTANLKRLFEDCHEYRREIGQFDGPVMIGDLEFCVKQRSIGYKSTNRLPTSWLPLKKDTELRALPEFKAIAQLYISNGNKPIPPKEIEKIKNESEEITLLIANHMKEN